MWVVFLGDIVLLRYPFFIYKNDVNFAIKDLNYCMKIDTIIIGMNWFNFKQNRKWRAENE